LGGYLLIRIIDIGKDSRFDKIRESPVKFLLLLDYSRLFGSTL